MYASTQMDMDMAVSVHVRFRFIFVNFFQCTVGVSDVVGVVATAAVIVVLPSICDIENSLEHHCYMQRPYKCRQLMLFKNVGKYLQNSKSFFPLFI